MIKITHINRSGFTLVETLLAALILAVALIAIVSAFYGEMAFIAEIKELSIATLAAEREIEIKRNVSFDALGSAYDFDVTGLKPAPGHSKPGHVEIDDPYTTTYMRRVSVTISWTSCHGKNLSRSIATLVTKNGIDKQ